MKQEHFLLSAVTLAFFLSPISRASAVDTSADEQRIKKIEQEWADAYVKRDAGFAERMTTEDFTFIGPDGALLNKPDYLSTITNEVVFTDYKIDQTRVRVYGTTAVVTALGSIIARLGDERLNERYSWTDVFVKQDGEWKRVAGHVSMVGQK
ncbi:MAG: nuclear transport factor 2 family protein [Chthoniobacterales bacterium]